MRVLLLCFLSFVVTAHPAFAQEVPQSRTEIALSFAPIVRQTAPAVVSVHSSDPEAERALFPNDPFLRRFFQGPGAPQRGSVLGSGVIVDASGLVVTNAHVVRSAREIRVAFNDHREYPATLLLKDERTDLAVLKIETEEETTFPFVTLGDPAALEVGDLVLAFGNPFGVGQTVTQGIVSALARTQVGVSDSRFFIQTDAAINPGNSGGALIDMAGRLVGINSAIYSRSGGSNGIGFAIPVDMVRIVVESAREGRNVSRPWFGARLESVDRRLAEQLGLDRPVGALISELLPKSPAADAGLRVADVVTSIDGIDIADEDSFGYVFATRGTEGEAEVGVMRDGAPQTFTVALEVPPETVPRDARRIGGRSPFTGAIAMNLSPAVADELNLDMATKGVVIARVDEQTIARRVGLRPRDIVREVNGWQIEDTAALENVTKRRERYWDIIIERDGEQLSLVLGG
ncbi:Do family serine endopeptidase [Acuticoccus sp. M5D2P5]|uniref:Do family serine endopeptidase n=1 Tax=Acuticoccus kalidii TaxID=2910977 RepID=UPI001F44C338|nr:Do family serine endopeptidase [Acuticoccus kalidii]MCF3936030.1 Do family serine endopeptidase [Acuticoccus kalidii]